MRVVIDARYVCARPGGIGRYVAAIAARMPAMAPDVRFRFWAHPERPQPAAGPNVRCHVVTAPADGLRTLVRPSSLDRLERDDVIHFPFSILAPLLPCVPVVTIADLMWLETPRWVDARPLVGRVRAPFYQLGMLSAMHRAVRIMTISQATADRVIAVVPGAAKRVVPVHLACDAAYRPPQDHDAARAAAARIVGHDAPYYLAVGKNEPYKGHEVALAAFAEAALAHERLVFLQRENSGRGLTELAAKLGVSARVVWLPHLTSDELITILQGAKALLQPSLMEGFGLPALEAISCGCPVIASDTPALVEVLGGAGVHASRGSAIETASAIRKLHDASFAADLRARGLERAKAFSWERCARETIDVYRDAYAAAFKV